MTAPDNSVGLDIQRAPLAGAIISDSLDKTHVPNTFPMHVWSSQSQRYLRYWRWFDGTELEATRKNSKDSKPIKKYPLQVNPIKNFAWKHAAVLLGEEATDTPLPLARMNITPKLPFDGSEEYKDEDKTLARKCQNVVNEVWSSSNGRSIQMENAVMAQFLGGCVFQVCYHDKDDPEYERLAIPVTIKNIVPDFFVPVWKGNNFWDLVEAFVVYRIPTQVAIEEYGYNNGSTAGSQAGWVTYCEHWTKTHYSVLINNTPISRTYRGKTITFNKLENPFGFVPFVYIPHVRAGEFHGQSMVDDLEGLIREFNSRLADVGDSIRETVHRKRYSRDLETNPKPKQIDKDVWAIDLGRSSPATKAQPDVWTEDPPALSEGMVNFSDDIIWSQLLREGYLSNIAFGEDDVSQRSAIALAMRMFPTTSHSRAERTFWTDGLTLIARMVLRICVSKNLAGLDIPKDFEKKLMFSVNWLPQIPRDREQQVNEVILRFQAGLMSLETGLKMMGDTEYIGEEVARIHKDMEYRARMEAAVKAATDQGGDGAKEKMTAPVAADGLDS